MKWVKFLITSVFLFFLLKSSGQSTLYLGCPNDSAIALKCINAAIEKFYNGDTAYQFLIDSSYFLYQSNLDYEMISYCHTLMLVIHQSKSEILQAFENAEHALKYIEFVKDKYWLDYLNALNSSSVLDSDIGNNRSSISKLRRIIVDINFKNLDDTTRFIVYKNLAMDEAKVSNLPGAQSLIDSMIFMSVDSMDVIGTYLYIKRKFDNNFERETIEKKIPNLNLDALNDRSKKIELYFALTNYYYDLGDLKKSRRSFNNGQRLILDEKGRWAISYYTLGLRKVNFEDTSAFICTIDNLIDSYPKYNAGLRKYENRLKLELSKYLIKLNDYQRGLSFLLSIIDIKEGDVASQLFIDHYILHEGLEILMTNASTFQKYFDGNIYAVIAKGFLKFLNLNDIDLIFQRERSALKQIGKFRSLIEKGLLVIGEKEGLKALTVVDLGRSRNLKENIIKPDGLENLMYDSLVDNMLSWKSKLIAFKSSKVDSTNTSNGRHNEYYYESKYLNAMEKLVKRGILNDHHIDTAIQLLTTQECVLETFVGDSLSHFFLYRRDGPVWHHAVSTSMLYELLKQILAMQADANMNWSDYAVKSRALYQMMFPPDVAWSEYGQLVVVPDGWLHRLSFESLVSEPNLQPRDPKAYLIGHIPVSYSLGLHLSRNFKNINHPDVVAFAPSFDQAHMASSRDCSQEVFGKLRCNEQEARSVSEILNGQYFTRGQATSANFMASVSDFDIFHLSTHACIDTQNYYNSSIIFEDDPLTMSDLYQTDWYNKTVVLSACNTAGGNLVSGEGVFNFARTFTELGCKEVIVSLWPIDDCSTKEFVSLFYKHKSDGQSSSQALQEARISYLRGADKLHAQPFFWAPLIVISNDRKVADRKPGGKVWQWMGWGLLAVGVGALIYKGGRSLPD